jgi:hypothetical protein
MTQNNVEDYLNFADQTLDECTDDSYVLNGLDIKLLAVMSKDELYSFVHSLNGDEPIKEGSYAAEIQRRLDAEFFQEVEECKNEKSYFWNNRKSCEGCWVLENGECDGIAGGTKNADE